MSNLLNALGYGLMGGVNAWNAGQDRQLRERALARQDALAQMDLAIRQRQLDMESSAPGTIQSIFSSMDQLGRGAPNFTPTPGQNQPNVVDAPGAATVNYKGPKVTDLPLQAMQLADYWGRYHGVPEDKLPFLSGIMAAESGGRQWAHNKANTNGTSDHGMMQINDVNLGRLKPGENVYDPTVNTRIGAQIFAEALKRSDGDALGALGAYNTGKVNANAPYVSRVLQSMGAGANDPGVQPVQLAAGGQRSMTDAAGPPPGVTTQGGGYVPMNQQQIALVAALKAHPNKVYRGAGEALEARDKMMREAAGYESPDVKRAKDEQAATRQAAALERQKAGIAKENPTMGPDQEIVVALAPRIADGSATEDEKRRYSVAYNKAYGQVQTLSDGSKVTQTPPSGVPMPEGMEPRVDKKPLAPGDAGKIQGAKLSTQYLGDVMMDLFDSDGKFNRTKLFKSMIPGAPEQSIRQKIREAMGYALYLKTGAAATPKEIDAQEDIYMPKVTDNDAVAKGKVDRLRNFLDSVVEGTGRASGAPQAGNKPGTDYKSKYGLEE